MSSLAAISAKLQVRKGDMETSEGARETRAVFAGRNNKMLLSAVKKKLTPSILDVYKSLNAIGP